MKSSCFFLHFSPLVAPHPNEKDRLWQKSSLPVVTGQVAVDADRGIRGGVLMRVSGPRLSRLAGCSTVLKRRLG